MHGSIFSPQNTDGVNPYRDWVRGFPHRLLATPDPAQLAALRALGHPGAPLSSGQAQPLVLGPEALHVELGSGSGNFLVDMAQRAPHAHFVGFELRFKRLVRATEKADRLGLGNLWFMREWGERFTNYWPGAEIDHLYVNFPDPWPKPSQWKKRMVNPPLMRQLAQGLKPGGIFHLKTDHGGYFLHSLSLAARTPEFRVVGFSNHLHRQGQPRVPGVGAMAVTEFERMFNGQGKPVYYLALQKNQPAS